MFGSVERLLAPWKVLRVRLRKEIRRRVRLERGARLRNELDSAIERLRPSGARPSPGTSVLGGWLHYLVLKEAYVDGRPNKQIMQRYLLSEGTFHRARRSAIDAVTGDVAGAASHRSAASLPQEGR